jgi:hypothetical protein
VTTLLDGIGDEMQHYQEMLAIGGGLYKSNPVGPIA